MARMTPTVGTAQSRENAAWRDTLLAARRGALAHGLTLLAEMGRDESTGAAFLARQDAAGALVGVRVWPRSDKRGHEFEMVFELDASLPGPVSNCYSCGRAVEGWSRVCTCGADVSGVPRAPTPDGQKAQRERVRHSTRDEYEILGSMAYSGGGGVVYFARHLQRDEIVPLRVYEKNPGGPITVVAGTGLPGIEELASLAAIGGADASTPEPFPAVTDPAGQPDADEDDADTPSKSPRLSGPGSILLRRHSKPGADEVVSVPKVCPRCGVEYDTASRYCPKDGSPLRPKDSADPLVGQVIADRYHVLKHLGEGGMGRVYLAEHVKMHRQCAIKVMTSALVNEPASAARFAREASSAARILHPNVAAVFDYGETDDVVYIVMEYVDGESVSAILKREKKLAPHRALDFARQIADGLVAAHELGIVHRDLKPDNILIANGPGGREVAKIVDFGIAKVTLETPQEGLTRTGFVIGTPEFMSPEQLLGDPVDARSDIYSLGCILYMMITGEPTFAASTREQMIKRRLSESPPHPNVLVPELHPTLDAIVVRMLERAPAARFTTAAEVRTALENAVASKYPTPAVVYVPTPRSVPTVSMDEVTEEALPPRRRWSTGRRATAGIVIGALALAATMATVQLRNRSLRLAAAAADSARAAAARDSLAKVAAAHADSQRAVTPPARQAGGAIAASPTRGDSAPKAPRISPIDSQVRSAISRYAAAFESGDTAKVRAAYPTIPLPQLDRLRTGLFTQADNIHAIVEYNAKDRIARDSADVDFTMRLRYTFRNGRTPGSNTLRYHAALVHEGGAWVLKSLQAP
jgi:serine/threonine protein kinase